VENDASNLVNKHSSHLTINNNFCDVSARVLQSALTKKKEVSRTSLFEVSRSGQEKAQFLVRGNKENKRYGHEEELGAWVS